MPSGRRYARRHRSQSASSPSRALFPADDPKWRTSSKRARLSSPRSLSYKELVALGERPEKWDVDQWRRGKRARRDASPRDRESDPYTLPAAFAPSSEGNVRSMSVPGLPSTSAAFNLFPERRHRKTRHPSPRSPPQHNNMSVIETGLSSAGELELRAHAFSELKRSVAESGEGQVQRLRDMENSRWRLSVDQRDRNDPPRGPRAQPGLPVLQNAEPATAWDEEDDVEIVSSEPASGSAHLHNRSSSCKKRAMSLNMMDMDIDVPDVDGPLSPALPSAEPSERCSSPFSAFTGPSVYSSEDDMSPVELDGATPYSEPNVPRLTLSYTASSNPSVVSLSPSSFAGATPAKADITDSATRSEKAIAALALAMANGACGLNDYSAIQHTEHTLDPSDGCQVGELWH